jgi:hypothetical protein
MTLNWTELLDFLSAYHNESSRELYEEENHIRHLIILNPHTYNLLLHFILPHYKAEQSSDNYDSCKPVVNIVCRETLDFKEFELQFAADLARTIGYWLWKKLT